MNKFYSFLLIAFFASQMSGQVVISQAYGGGGNSGSTYTNDFIELFNRGSEAVNLEGLSVQYASAMGATFSGVSILPNFNLQPGQYFLIQQAQGNGGTTPLPTPDFIPETPIAMSGTNFKIVLAQTTEVVSGCDDASIIDLVGFGSANCFEGSGTASVLSNTNSGSRLFDGCQDTNNNLDDFVVGLPNPRNSSTTLAPCTSGPSLAISLPSNNQVFAPESEVTINFSVSNFVVGNPGDGIDGHIHYFLNGDLTMYFSTDPINLGVLPAGVYVLEMELVDNNHQPLSPSVSAEVSFEVADYLVVENLAVLRQDVVANGAGKYYQIMSNPVITYARAFRNQKYIQDDSAAILIDDATEVLSTQYSIGNALSGLKGRTSIFNGLLQLVPNIAANAFPGTEIVPETVTIEALNENIEAYESELVFISNVSFPIADGAVAFASNQNYDLTDSQFTITLRTGFNEANYIDELIPQGQRNVIVLVAKFVTAEGTTNQVLARSMEDLDATLSAPGFNAIEGLKMFPNPAKDNISIQTPNNEVKKVVIYNVLGREVLNTTTIQNVSISNLISGVYIVKITENGITATRKLIVE